MPYICDWSFMILREQLTDGVTALSSHTGSHPAAGKCLALIRAHTTQFGDFVKVTLPNIFTTADNGFLIRRCLECFQRAEVIIKKPP